MAKELKGDHLLKRCPFPTIFPPDDSTLAVPATLLWEYDCTLPSQSLCTTVPLPRMIFLQYHKAPTLFFFRFLLKYHFINNAFLKYPL